MKMTTPRKSEPVSAPSGFITPTFAALALGLSLIAIAALLASNTTLRGAEHDWRREQDRYALEGAAATAELTLLKEAGTPTLKWSEAEYGQSVQITASPEFLKLAPSESGRDTNRNVFVALLGAQEADRMAKQVANLTPSADGVIHRSAIEDQSDSRPWRACALGLLSPLSRLTAVALHPAQPPSGGGASDRAGEIWRITTALTDGAWLESLVRFTRSATAPVAILGETFHQSGGALSFACFDNLAKIEGP